MRESNAAKVRVRVGQFNHVHCVFVDGTPVLYGLTRRQANRFAVDVRTALGLAVVLEQAEVRRPAGVGKSRQVA